MGLRKAEQLTPEQIRRIVTEYRGLERGPTGRVRHGLLDALARKWRRSRAHICDLVQAKAEA